MATKKTAAKKTDINSSEDLIDIWLEVPKEEDQVAFPDKIHILFNRNAVLYSEQYRDALLVARGLPFDVNNVGVTDPMTLIVANTMGAKGKLVSEDAVRRAQQFYSKWITEAEKEAWTLAIMYDNVFENVPTEYDPPRPPPPGIAQVPEPQRRLIDPAEYRLKQLLDVMNVTTEFRNLLERTINNVLTQMAQYGQAVQIKDSFRVQPKPTGIPLPGNDGTVRAGVRQGPDDGQDSEG